MKISLSRIFYYITLLCIFIAGLKFVGFDLESIKYLFLIHILFYEILQGMHEPPSDNLREMLNNITVIRGMLMITGLILTVFLGIFSVIGLIQLHLIIMYKTKVKE